MADAQSVFQQGAERLEQVVRALKTQQIEERQGPIHVAATRSPAASPDELWAKEFATQCIGPVCFTVPPGSETVLKPLSRAINGFEAPRQNAYSASLDAGPAPAKAQAAAPVVKAEDGPMGRVIGRPPRRGLFARMFGRR